MKKIIAYFMNDKKVYWENLVKISLSVILCLLVWHKMRNKREKKNSRHKRKGYFVEETNDYSTIYFEGEQVSMRY